MEPGRWERIEELFERALLLPEVERSELLSSACAGDSALRAEVEEMLAAAGPGQALAIERLAPDATPDPMLGTVLGAWRLLEPLGHGGMGTVYRVERADGQYRQQAALKLVSLTAWTPDTVARFRAERQVLARLSHPNIARLLDGGLAADGRPYLVMELVEGAPITEYCLTQRLSLEERLRLFRLVCDAVQHAHGALVVHRDLKPANTFVSAAGEVKLLDFGIAKLLAPPEAGDAGPPTREQSTRLTPEYAAPEQLLGGPVTTATDVYSLGVLLYEMLTGVRPLRLEGKTPLETERQLLEARIAPPSQHLQGRGGSDLDAIVLTALRAQAERRYVSAGQLGEDIGRYLEGRPVLARPDTLAYRARRFVGRNREAVFATAVFAISLVTFGVAAGWQARRAAAERDAAEVERAKAEKVLGVLVDLFERSNPNVHPDGDKMSTREFLAQAEPRVLDRLDGQPAVRARLRQVFGLIHMARDQFPEAKVALEKALDEQRRLLGPDHPDAIESLYHLAMLKQGLGEEKPAQALLEETLERCLRVFGEDHEKTARTLSALATPERLEEGGALLRRALAIRRRVLPPDHPDIAVNLGQLAHYHHLRKEEDRSTELYTEALAMFRTEKERRDPKAINLLNDHAEMLANIREYKKSEAMQRQSLELARAVFGPDSLQAAYSLNNLAVSVALQGRLDESLQTLWESHQRLLAVLGEDHWRTVNVARNIGWILALQRREAEGLEWMDRALASLLRTTHLEHRKMRFHVQGRRAQILLRLGRGKEAVQILQSTLTAHGEAKVPGSEYIGTDLRMGLALALLETGQPTEAVPHARAAVAELEREPANDPTRAQGECLLGGALVESGSTAEGRLLLDRCLPEYRRWGLADTRLVASLDALVEGHAP